jgi:lipid-binding SYLF domain-containing protein
VLPAFPIIEFKTPEPKILHAMKTLLKLSCLIASLALFSPILSAAEQDRVDQAAAIVARFRSMPERGIPNVVLRHAYGLAILNVVKAGFIWSGRYGEGVVVARVGRGWSGPAFVKTAGVGFGAQIGGQVTEIVLVLNTPQAVRSFSSGTNVQLGGALSVAAGPVGRAAEADVTPRAAVYSYSVSQGLFAGVSLEGTVIEMNPRSNARYYGVRTSAAAILNGQVAPPHGARVLLRELR